MKYVVEVKETLSLLAETEADDAEMAISDVMEQYYSCNIILGAEQFCGVEFTIYETKDD